MNEALTVNHDILKRFAFLNERERLAHAYLFVGPRDIGKHQTALGIAKWFNCEKSLIPNFAFRSYEMQNLPSVPTKGREDNPAIPNNLGIAAPRADFAIAKSGLNVGKNYFCDECWACSKINAGNHPDVHVLETGEGEFIKIENIRGLLSQAKLRPFTAQRKIFILKNVENLTDESANALLKTLEEPTATSLLLLTTPVPENVLDTVKSRCHIIHFFPMDVERLADEFIKHYDEDKDRAHFLAYFSKGTFGWAKKLRDEKFFERKNAIIEGFLLRGNPTEVFLKEVLADKGKTRQFLDVLLTWIRDVLLVKAGVEDKRLIHLDQLKALKDFHRRFSFEELAALNKEIVNMSKMLAENLNIKIPLLIIKEQLHGTNR